IDDSTPASPCPTSPIVTFEEEEEEQGANARELEEVIQGEQQQQQQVSKKGRVPSVLLTKVARNEIRVYEEYEFIEFIGNNSKTIRDKYKYNGREDKITKLDDWTRIVFLAFKYKEGLSANDGYSEFHQDVINKKMKSKKR
ncbi:hypothetical protein ACJMK2_038234, partial [Sinanodonta woodiana]